MSNEALLDDFKIPSWDDLSQTYAEKWIEEKNKLWGQLKENFRALVENYRTGKQSVYKLSDGPYAQHYIQAFRELFKDSGYAATPGEWERPTTGATKFMELYITLPDCFSRQGL